MQRRVMPAAALAAALVVPGLAAAEDIPVGHIADLTGATATVGVPYADGIRDAMNYRNAHGGIAGSRIAFETQDYGYQQARAISVYQALMSSGHPPVAIQGWGTQDTEALTQQVAEDEVPYYSGSYSGNLTDPTGHAPNATRAAPYNFFYGPSYSDACRALVQWARDDWQNHRGQGQNRPPRWVHMGDNHPYPNAPKRACMEYAQELGFQVLDPIIVSLAPGDFTPQCLTLRDQGADYAYIANTSGSTISLLNACATAGVQTQFVSNVWGYDENVMRAAGQAANGVVVAVRTGSIWTDDNPGIQRVREISRQSDQTGHEYRPLSYLAAVCSSNYMMEAMDWAAGHGGVTGPNIRQGMYQRPNWVPAGLEGVCMPSTWTATDHRGLMQVPLYRGRVTGPTEGHTVGELMAAGTIGLERVTVVELPRRPEWLGY